MTDGFAKEALRLLRRLTADEEADFRPDQLDSIRRLVARMLRDRGKGPTLLISPLLALMRNQVEAAESMGVRTAAISFVMPGPPWSILSL